MMKSRIRQSSTIRKKVNLFRNKQSSCDDTSNHHHHQVGESNADGVTNESYFHDGGGILEVDDDELIAMVERHNNTLVGIISGDNNTTAKNQAAPPNPLTMDNEQVIAMYENDLKKFGLHPSSSSAAGATTTSFQSKLQANDNGCNNAAMSRPPRPESFCGVNVNTNNNNNAKPQSSILRRNNAKPPLPHRNNNDIKVVDSTVIDSINTVQNKRRSGNQRNANNKSSPSSSSANTSNTNNNNNNHTKKLASAEHIVLQKMSKSFDSLSKSYDELLERHYLKDTLPPPSNNNTTCCNYDWIGIILHWFGYNRCGDAAVDRNRPVDEITIDYNSDGRRNGVRSGMRSQGGTIKCDYDYDDDDAYTNPSTATNMNWKQQNRITGKIKNNNSKIIETGKQSQRRRMSGPPIANYLVSQERRSNSNSSNEQLTRETLYSISHQDSKNSKPKNNLCNSSRGGNNNNVLVVQSRAEQRNDDDPIQLRRQGTDSLLDELRQSVV